MAARKAGWAQAPTLRSTRVSIRKKLLASAMIAGLNFPPRRREWRQMDPGSRSDALRINAVRKA